MPDPMAFSSDDDGGNVTLWPTTESLLLRAERLLERSIQQLEEKSERHDQHKSRVALELERILAPLQQLNQGLGTVIENMAHERQDNRSQRWQGQLQDLMTPLDSAILLLQEVLIQLEEPADSQASGGDVVSARARGQRLQLQQLLALRQRQVLELQAEVQALRKELFQGCDRGPAPSDSEASIGHGAELPTIFGDAGG
jgi:hypothetical protein